ncbi:MAG: peptidoglycan DD-metalloendopeptidase family protein [Alphaproteobacteria bacterium]|nr:peptidoglycan DD-metalloendopeptidase family protein [Alphaproteobacteria bacterium]
MIAAAMIGVAGTNLSVDPNQGIEIASAEAGIVSMPVVAKDTSQATAEAVQQLAMAPMPPAVPAKPVMPANYSRKVTIQSGDTLSSLMEHASVDGDESFEAIKALKEHIDPRELKAGQAVTVNYSWSADAGERMTSMEFTPTPLTRVVLKQQGANGGFKVEKMEKQLKGGMRAAKAKITSSIYSDLRRQGVPDSIIAEAIKVYSYSIDFARDIWAGDSIEILYSVNSTEDGQFVKGDELMYATLTVRGKPNTIIRMEQNGGVEYFDGKGEPVKKALLRTPVDGARVTSGFGMRRHPIQGYNKMHKGMDFGAPTGTPIFAAGDGVVSRANWFSGYGKYVSIKHNGTYSTAYAHMSQIMVKAGQRVKQGQIIGRVGTTGNSTGPHLHFEVLKAGAQINPKNVANLSIGNKLTGKQLARLQTVAANAKSNIESIISGAARPMLASAQTQR